MQNDPTGRALQLLSLLQTHRFWSCDELSRRLDVTKRTVRRDVDRLRQLGYPVDSTSGKYGGYRLESGAHLPPLVLDDDDAVAVAVGLRAAAQAAIVGMDEASLRTLVKIERLLPDRVRRRVSALHGNLISTQRPPNGDIVDPDVLTALAVACRDGERVRFTYRRRDGESASRLVEPHRVVTSGRRWYLLAWDRDRDDWRTFRLDRLADIRAAGRRFETREMPAGDAALFVARSVESSSRPLEATLVIGATLDNLADDLRWIDHTPVEEAGGSSVVRVRGEDAGRLALTIARLALGAPVTVVEPHELAALVRSLGENLRDAPRLSREAAQQAPD